MSTPPLHSREPRPWTRHDLPEISDPLEQPHPLEPLTPRRLWSAWHYAVLIYPEPRERYRPALAALFAELGGGERYNAIVRQLRWMHQTGIDPEPINALIGDWSSDLDARHRAINAATAKLAAAYHQETHP